MTQLITGHTKIIAHLGVPTESFRAPMIYNPFFKEQGVDCVVVPMGCGPDDFPQFMRMVARLTNFTGALITMPHKVPVVDLLDEMSPAVRVCGACNAVKRGDDGRLLGDMFDGEGFSRGLLRKGCGIAGRSALVVGSGGVGSAIAAALAGAGLARLGLYDVNGAAADRVAGRLSDSYPAVAVSTGSNDPEGWDIVVNATPLGMNEGDPMPVDVARIAPTTFVGEVVMKREETAFLAAARAQGCATQVGSDMLFEQIPAYLEFFGLPTTTPDVLRRVSRLTY